MAKKRVASSRLPSIQPTPDEQWEIWQRDIARIYKETIYFFESRLVFREIQRMFKDNPRLKASGGFIYNWLLGIYGRDMVLAVGRELDRGTEVVNLIRLMYQMAKRQRVITRKRYQAHFQPDSVITPEMQVEQFERLTGSKHFLTLAAVKRDRNWLEKRCRKVVSYRHKMVAHRTPLTLALSLADIDKALDAIEKMLQKYYVVLTGSALVTAEPAIQFNWQDPFKIPWLAASVDDDD